MVMNKINNKGYMLVELILASLIAFGVAYTIINLTVKLKNKNDDLLVETQVTTDKTIITNKLMKYAISEGKDFNCGNLRKNGNIITYNGNTIDIINEYTSIGSITCDISNDMVNIRIPLDVDQMNNKDFDVLINYKYKISDIIAPECTLKVDESNISFNTKTDNIGILSYGLVNGTVKEYNSLDSISIDAGTFTGYVMDNAGNENTCSIEVSLMNSSTTYTCKKNYDSCPSGWNWQTNGCFEYVGCYSAIGTCSCLSMKNVTRTSNGVTKSQCNTLDQSGEFYWCSFSGTGCGSCPSGYYDYGSTDYCYRSNSYSECSGAGWSKSSGACYKYNQSSCPSGSTSTINISNTCPDGFTILNDSYCYK